MAVAKRRLSHPEQLARGHERRGTLLLVAAPVAGIAGVTVFAASRVLVGVALAGAAVALVRARYHFARARRAEIGARSERETSSALAVLERRGWDVAANVVLPGRGDIDHVVKPPGGPYFAIETKTRRFHQRDLDRTVAAARFVAGHSRPQVPTIPVLATAEKRHTSVQRGVIVCWIRNLVSVIDKEHRAYWAQT